MSNDSWPAGQKLPEFHMLDDESGIIKWPNMCRHNHRPVGYGDSGADDLIDIHCPVCEEKDKIEEAYEIGALAMAHYYHRDYAGDDFKMDHGNRAMRSEHLNWAKVNYKKLKAELTEADKEFFKDVPETEEPEDRAVELAKAVHEECFPKEPAQHKFDCNIFNTCGSIGEDGLRYCDCGVDE